MKCKRCNKEFTGQLHYGYCGDCARKESSTQSSALYPYGDPARLDEKSSAPPTKSTDTNHGWLTRMTEDIHKYREALNEIAYIQNMTATPEQFARHLQRVARRALHQ